LKHTILTDTNEHITIKRPENSANNLIIGTLYIDVHGIVEVHNLTKNIKAVIDISRQSWSNRTPFGFTGKITDQYDNVKMLVEGTWNKDYYLKDPVTGVKEKIFEADVRPANSARQYEFGYYSINLNYVNEEMLRSLPPTDCRRRMDQRFMEEGRYDEAIAEKHRLEEK
jgi:hypothetical protein